MSIDSNAEDRSYQDFRTALDEVEGLEQELMRTSGAATTAAADPRQQFCQAWPTIRRILEALLRIPFIPGKGAIRLLIQLGNALCG